VVKHTSYEASSSYLETIRLKRTKL